MDSEIHPDFLKYKNVKPPLNPAILPIVNFFLAGVFNRTSVGAGLTQARYSVAGYKGGAVRLSVISPQKCDGPLPALVYFHGGAFAMQAAPYLKRLAARYALETPCKVVLVDYRLLPKARFPMGLEDCAAAYRWVTENAEALGIDAKRLAVGGDSAGGALSIGACLLAHARGLAKPCFQMLIYPVTDEGQNTASMKQFADTPLWNNILNAKMWKMYLKGVPPSQRKNASPAAASSFAGIPPTYVEVSEFDCLRDEGIAFARALQESGIATELFQTKGTVHGFEIAEQNEIVLESVARRIKALKGAFVEKLGEPYAL